MTVRSFFPLRAHSIKVYSAEFGDFHFYLLFEFMPPKCAMQFSYARKRWTSSRKSFKTNNILEVLLFSVMLFSSQQLRQCQWIVYLGWRACTTHSSPFASNGRAAADPIRRRWCVWLRYFAKKYINQIGESHSKIVFFLFSCFLEDFFLLVLTEKVFLSSHTTCSVSSSFQPSYIFCRSDQHKLCAVFLLLSSSSSKSDDLCLSPRFKVKYFSL